jgi:hypothetical protein
MLIGSWEERLFQAEDMAMQKPGESQPWAEEPASFPLPAGAGMEGVQVFLVLGMGYLGSLLTISLLLTIVVNGRYLAT